MKAIGLYENDEYWIQDAFGEHPQPEVSGKATIKDPEVFLAKEANPSMMDIDEEILVDLEHSEEERAEAIMKEICLSRQHSQNITCTTEETTSHQLRGRSLVIFFSNEP